MEIGREEGKARGASKPSSSGLSSSFKHARPSLLPLGVGALLDAQIGQVSPLPVSLVQFMYVV